MIENTTYIKCRPSQLLNLGNFLLILVLIPLLFRLDGLIREKLPGGFISEEFEFHMLYLPVYLGIIAGVNLVYHILRVRCIRYEISPEELEYHSGIFYRKHEYIELYRVKDYQVDRPLLYRIFGLGNLIINTSDKTIPVFRMKAIRNPEDIYTVLRAFVERNRREKHVYEVD